MKTLQKLKTVPLDPDLPTHQPRSDVFIATGDFNGVPTELGQACVLARNGLFSVRRLSIGNSPFIELVSKLGPGYEMPGMQSFFEEGLRLCAPKISRRQLQEVESFFRAIYKKYSSEAICFLYFSPANGGQWQFAAVEQTVSSGHLDWTSPGPPPAGWYLAGSFHSHGSMSAFHSGTDDHDELGWDGIHVTVGKVTSPHPEYAASLVIGGQRFKVEIEDLCEPAENVDFPANWLEVVKKYEPPPVSPLLGSFGYPYDFSTGKTSRRGRSHASSLHGGDDYGE